MRPNRLLCPLLLLCLAALLLSACGGPGDDLASPTSTSAGDLLSSPTPPTPTAAPTPIPPPETATPLFSVTKDIAYVTPAQSDKSAWLLDVYAPTVPQDWPTFVFFHGGNTSKEDYGIQMLAQSIAEKGAVVFVPNLITEGTGRQILKTENGAGLRQELEAAACSIRYARVKAADFGGASDKVTVIGHSGGGYDGLWITLVGDDVEKVWDDFAATRGGPPHQMDCAVEDTVSAQLDTFVGYAGAYTYFDEFEADDPELFEVVDPATHIAREPEAVIRLIAAEREFVMPKWLTEHNELLYQRMLETGYNITWTVADGSHMMEAPARASILKYLADVVVVFEEGGCVFSGPPGDPPASLHLSVDNPTGNDYALVIATLKEGATKADLEAWSQEGTPPFLNRLLAHIDPEPGKYSERVFQMRAGTEYYFVCATPGGVLAVPAMYKLNP